MKAIGIICEYNPFHLGHLYQINKIKEKFPDSILIVVMSSCFTQRGDISIINKWDKTTIAIENGIDIVIELPFVFATQSADVFAKGAVKILEEMKCDYLAFGSESNKLDELINIADIQINDESFDVKLKEELKKGVSYPTAVAKVIDRKLSIKIDTPNDLLGISYIKEIIKNKYNIKPITIKRTNSYHSLCVTDEIISASAIRNLIMENKNIDKYVPNKINPYKTDKYFFLLKYKILSDINVLDKYQTVDEGIDKRIKKYINDVNSKEELIKKIKTKRYTYNKINRMLLHIFTSFTKEEAKNIEITYIKVLGFNEKGKAYLNEIKKDIKISIITSYKNMRDKKLNIEYRVNNIYASLVDDNELIKRELKKPIIK